MASIELSKVDKHYGDVEAINNLNLKIEDKEFMVLVGPSGCGKSTTLNLIAGLEFVTEGKVEFDGHDVTMFDPKERKVAMVFQSYALYPHMNAYENMAFGLRLSNIDDEIIDKRVREAARSLEIEELLDRKPKNLSGGQRQRIALGRAIVRNPTVFLLDEPLSNLDAKLRVTMRAEIKKLHRKLNTTFVYVTHDQVEAMSMADRITILDKGVIQQVGSPEEVYNAPANQFVAGFIGSPSMNFLDAKLLSEDGKTIIQVGDIDYHVPEKIATHLSGQNDVILGIRPEHIKISPDPFDGAHKVINDVIEYLGSDTLVRVVMEDDESIVIGALFEGTYRGKIGKPAYINWDPEVMHVFDKNTKQNLLVELHKDNLLE